MHTFIVRTTSGGKKLPLLTLTQRVTAATKARAAIMALTEHRKQVASNVNITLASCEPAVNAKPLVGETFAAFQARTLVNA